MTVSPAEQYEYYLTPTSPISDNTQKVFTLSMSKLCSLRMINFMQAFGRCCVLRLFHERFVENRSLLSCTSSSRECRSCSQVYCVIHLTNLALLIGLLMFIINRVLSRWFNELWRTGLELGHIITAVTQTAQTSLQITFVAIFLCTSRVAKIITYPISHHITFSTYHSFSLTAAYSYLTKKITRCNAPLPSSLLLHSHLPFIVTFHLPSFTFFRLTFLLHIFSLYSRYKKGLDCTEMWLLWPGSLQTQKSK